jgi:zinc/manganese transport system substrate-binding protein
MAAGLFPAEADAQLKVVACVPEWAALAQAIGGDKVTVTLATSAQENPDGFKATPVLISALQEADLLACTGLGLWAGVGDILA